MPDLNDLFYFVRVVDHGGFAAASRAMLMQKSKLSRRILLLEERLGVRLINRSTRQFSVTDVGRDYYDRCVAMLAEVEAAEQVVAEILSKPKGLIRINCPAALLYNKLGPLFTRFLALNPGIEIVLENNCRSVDVIANGFDIAILARFLPIDSTQLVTRKLGTIPHCLVAAPVLLEGLSLHSPADLVGLPSIAQGPWEREHLWRLERADGSTANVRFAPRFVSDDISAARDAVLAGLGIARLPMTYVEHEVQAGKLAHVLPSWKPMAAVVHALFPSRRGIVPSVRALIDFLASECAANRASSGERRLGSISAAPAVEPSTRQNLALVI